ncbi:MULTISPECIES: hypothetical protein [unclassified Halobacteriovorax]|uniref:hypothetical protein n=1 Tax=unclassified Halobacteriovorax TaxID=2639665 RepID=UPI0039997C35
MGITQLITNPYEKVHPYSSGKPYSMVPGQIAWVPTVFIDKNMTVIYAERASADVHDTAKLKFERLNSNHFKSSSILNRVPIPNLKLQETEELMAFKAKKRPCIYIGKADILPPPLDETKKDKGARHQYADDFVFIPMYSTHQSDPMKGFRAEFVKRIKHLHYTHFVFLKDCRLTGLETDFVPNEGIARLDRLFITNPVVPNVTPTDIKLTDEYFNILLMHVREYLLKETDEDLSELRDCINLSEDE